MNEGVIWVLVILNLWIILDYEMNGRKFRNERIDTSRKKSQDLGPSLIWNDIDRFNGR